MQKLNIASFTAAVAFLFNTEYLAPHMDADAFRGQKQAKLDAVAFENSWLQAGFFLQRHGRLIWCGPMSGFDKAKIDEAFYKGSSWRSLFLMNLAYGDTAKQHPRGTA